MTCYKCGKAIKGKQRMVVSVPSNLAKSLGDFDKNYHEKCYQLAELEAKLLLENKEGE